MQGKSNKIIVLVGTLDSKGQESAFLKSVMEARGFKVITIDVGSGSGGQPPYQPDFTRDRVAGAGGSDMKTVSVIAAERKSHEYDEIMGKGAARIVRDLYDAGKLDGIISLGGNAGTSLGSLAMKLLPFGVPKVICSTVASGNTRHFLGTKDICMMPSIADIAGLNRITRVSLTCAAGCVMGMVDVGTPNRSEKPLIAMTEIGRLADHSKRICKTLEREGYEAILFHAVGTGGMALEEMIEQGYVEGVLDLSMNEIMDHFHGGFTDAGPARLEAAARKGIPAVIAPGYANRIHFNSKDSMPKKFEDRDAWVHGASIHIVPVTKQEILDLAGVLVEKLNQYKGPTAVLLPLKGLSSPIGRFDDPEINAVFFQELKQKLRPEIEVKELNAHVLDGEFIDAAIDTLLNLLERSRRST